MGDGRMKFVTVRTDAGPRAGVVDPEGLVRLLPEGTPMTPGALRAAAEAGSSAPETWERAGGGLEDLDLDAPLRPGKIVCVGANYAEHVREAGAPMPAQPILFLKNPDVVVGPDDPLLIPPGSTSTDFEVELGVVIGSRTAYLPDPSRALERVAGYVLANDVSERDFQLERGGTWDKGKNCPTFCPLGPVFVTADEIPDPRGVRLGTDLNGRALQDGTTSDMIFDVPFLLHYISQYMTLYPGDVVLTGTPAGVGQGQDPARYLRPGDRLRLWASGLGEQHASVAATPVPVGATEGEEI